MTSVKVQFEIGHEASIRTKKTPEGFTHDWEVFVRGQDGADISHFVEKVVFYLHETFLKPKRVVREPPFAVKESGYAGFNLPIEIYVKNRDEPKKIRFHYDLNLPQTGPATYNFLKDRYIFENPNEDFKKKLLKGGGMIVSNNAFYTNPDQETRSRDSFTDEKPHMSKPKLSAEPVKKYKAKEELPHRTTSSFENLFGAPIQKPPKVSPDIKKVEKPVPPVKTEKKEKDRSSSEKQKQKHGHKESKPDKVKIKEEKEKDKIKIEKPSKSHSKEVERSKDKSNKRPNERPPSPDAIKKKCISPPRRPPSPPPRSSSASSIKDEYKPKIGQENIELKKPPVKVEVPEIKVEKESKEKKKKEKKSHERDKERKEKKEHKKESHKPKEPIKEPPKEIAKPVEIPKDIVKEPQFREKPMKAEKDKPFNKFSIENLRKTPQDTTERLEEPKKEKLESERKHKHKKKDKKRDESREKHKDSKEKKHKHDKVKENALEKVEVVEREMLVPKERPPLETTSPISLDNSSQCSSKSGLQKESLSVIDDVISALSDSDESVTADEVKIKMESPSPESVKEPEPTPEPEPEPIVPEPPQPQHKEKSKKHKDKSSRREEKRRKRKAAEEVEENNRKVVKLNDMNVKTESECGETSGLIMETKVQDNGVSSSLGEDGEPSDLSPNYMDQLRELQQRILTIKSNEELDRVVNLIAETGRYEVTTQTFDFDLCLLDRSTVQQLIQLIGC